MHNVEERSLSTVTVYTRSSHTSDTRTDTGGTLRVVSMRTAARTVVFHTTCMPVSEYRDDVAGRQRLAGTSFYISGDRCDKINGLPH